MFSLVVNSLSRFTYPLCRTLILALILAVLPTRPTRALESGLPREAGVFYLEDFLTQPFRLRVLGATAIFFNSDQARFLGTLRAGQAVEVQAVSENGTLARVRGQAGQGQVAGWVDARSLTPINPAFLKSLHRSAERRERVKALVAANEVALGMTPNEVTASLGAPPKRSSRTDANGISERWEYIRYQSVPRQVSGVDNYGRLITSVVYEKVPVGSFGVVFTNGSVSAIEQSEGNLAAAAQVKIVPPPVDLVY